MNRMTSGLHKPNSRTPTDRRYRTSRWQRVRLRVLARDGWRCFEPGCPNPASVADHIVPVVMGVTSDLEFYSADGLRAACRAHNLARPVVDATAAALRGEVLPAARPTRYAYGGRPMTKPAPIVDRHEPGDRYAFPFHNHPRPDGMPYLVGHMGTPRWDGPGCPPECGLPRPEPATPPRGQP